jgi:uncharacterized protein
MTEPEDMKCRVLVVKVASRCNINCKYCYMYNMGDDSYKQQPKFMSEAVVNALMERIRAHCLQHELKQFVMVLHGGEPLLAGHDFFRYFVQTARSVLQPDVDPIFSVQTNGILLDDEWCRVLDELKVHIGISMDGDKPAHDMNRVDHQGNGTYDRVLLGLRTAQQSPHLHSKPGILSVMNVFSDPNNWFDHILSLKVKECDVLIPEATYENPPPGYALSESWLITLFDRWMAQGDADGVHIRLFSFLINQMLGREQSLDVMGNKNNEVLVIETDGGIESVDVLKACGEGFTKAGANVLTHSFDEALQTPLARMYHLSHSLLARKCTVCPLSELCGGGYIPHRFSKAAGFNNPSVYCNDLIKLITHIQRVTLGGLPPEMLEELGIELLDYETVQQLIAERLPLTEEPEYAGELEKFGQG